MQNTTLRAPTPSGPFAQLRFGNSAKVVSLCETFVRSKNGLWQKPAALTEVLFDGTKQFKELHRQ